MRKVKGGHQEVTSKLKPTQPVLQRNREEYSRQKEEQEPRPRGRKELEVSGEGKQPCMGHERGRGSRDGGHIGQDIVLV